MPDPVEQDFTADGSAYLSTLMAMSAATDAWANGVIGDAAKAQAAIDALHGETINIGVDANGIGQTAAATDALNQALADVAVSNAANARAAQDNAGATTAAANAAIFGTQAMNLFTIGFGIAHVAITSLGANIIADAVGFTAFGIAAVQSIGPVVTSLSTLTTSYGALDNYQRAAALSLQSFLNGLGGGNEPQVFTVFNQALGLIESHMGGAAGVTSQASIAFMDFFAMLKQQFASSGWTAMFSRSTGVIRTDMDALFGLFNNVLGLIPAVFHDFNGLGLGVIGFAGGLLHATAAVLEFNPALTKTVAGISLAATAWHLLGNSISWVPAMGPTIGALGRNMTSAYQGARILGMGMGEAALAATGLTVATGVFALAAAGLVAYAFATRNVQTPVEGLISSLTAQDQAVGDNAAGYEKLSQQLGTYANVQKLANIGVVAGGHDNAMLQSSFYDMGQASEQAAQKASMLRTNFGYLESTYGLTRQQAYQLAQATGVNLKDALTGSSTAAQEARGKIATYEQTMATAAGVESQFTYDMQQATNKTLTMTDRLQGLSEAFTVLSGPLLGAMSATATFKQQQDALTQAVKTDGTEVGTNTQKQAALTLALAQAAHGAMQASTAILNNTQSARQAAGPLIAMRDEILDLGLKGQAAAALISQLNQEIAALHSKTVTLTVNTVQTTTVYSPTYAHRSAQGGYASGTTSATSGIHPLAEQGAELVTQPGMYAMSGGQQVYNAAQTRAILGGGGGTTVNVTVNVAGSVLAQQDLRASVQEAVLDAWTRTGATGFVPFGHPLR